MPNDMAAPAENLRLRPPRHRVERRAIGRWALRSLLTAGPLLVAAAVAHHLRDPAGPALHLLVAAAAALVVAKVGLEPLRRHAVHRWEITDEAVYATSGWLVQEWRVTPLSRIQTVDAVRGPLEQLLGLSTLRITTASSRGAVVITGLDQEVAAEAVRELAAVTAQTPGDAT